MLRAVADFERNDFAVGLGRHSEHHKWPNSIASRRSPRTSVSGQAIAPEPKSWIFPSFKSHLAREDGSTGDREVASPWRG